MTKQNIHVNYLFNCFWVTIPPTLISVLLTNHLPEVFQTKIFWDNIPPFVKYPENIFRTLVITLPVFFPLNIANKLQRVGLLIYFIGLAVYLLSYVSLIYFAESSWGKSLVGFSAPATTPLIWFVGIGLIMGKPFFNITYSKWVYITLIITFCVFHFTHTSIIYSRFH